MMADGRILVTGGIVGWDETGAFPDGFVGRARRTFETSARSWPRAERARGTSCASPGTWSTSRNTSPTCAAGPGPTAKVFGTHYPAMALIQVVRLVEKEARLEIEATAVVPRMR